jgi:hypothetical protein
MHRKKTLSNFFDLGMKIVVKKLPLHPFELILFLLKTD